MVVYFLVAGGAACVFYGGVLLANLLRTNRLSELSDKTFYDEDTLAKVYDALLEGGVSSWQEAENLVNAMLNTGIVFRERL